MAETSASSLQRLLGIALLRAGPDELPCSNALLGGTIAATAAINYPVIQRYTPEVEPLVQILLLIVYNAAFLAGALWLRGLPGRFTQTATAVFGTDAIISAVALPVLLGLGQPNETNGLAAGLFLALLLWNVAVVSRILRAALSMTTGFAVGLALVYLFGASVFVRGLTGA